VPSSCGDACTYYVGIGGMQEFAVSDVFLLIIGKSWVWRTKVYQAGSRENQATSRDEAPFVH
jgi:hypothetical protein